MKPQPSPSSWNFICRELSPFPGRDKAVFRFLVVNALVIVLSMTFQVPFLALSLIMTFFTARENTVLTRMTGVVMVLGGTLGVCVSIGLLKVAFDYPLVRILLTAVSIFIGMYFFRISQLGVMGFILAILVSYTQSLVDIIPNPEMLVRMLLWAWVAAVYPIIITLLVNTLMFPASPVSLLKRASVDILDIVIQALHMREYKEKTEGLKSIDTARLILSLQQHLTHSRMSGAQLKNIESRHIQYVSGLERLLNAAVSLSENNPSLYSREDRELCYVLQANVISLRCAIDEETAFSSPLALAEHPAMQDKCHGALREMACVFIELANGSQENLVAECPGNKPPLFVPDAWTNPNYGRFAVKSVLATLLCYVFYSVVDWQGIHTAMLTCLILALPSTGAITHKGMMRLIGCMLGSATALLTTIFIVPYLDSIVGLLAMSLPVIAASAWIASGSERSNYIGVQMAFAFALSMFDQFGPTVSLTEIRDRVVGILLGVAVSTLIYTCLWPERDSQRLNNAISQLLKLLGQMIALQDNDIEPGKRNAALAVMRKKGWGLLVQCEELLLRGRLETVLGHTPHGPISATTSRLEIISDIFMSINTLQFTSDAKGKITIKPFIRSVAEYFFLASDIQRNPQRSRDKIDEAFSDVYYQVLSYGALNRESDHIYSIGELLHRFHKTE